MMFFLFNEKHLEKSTLFKQNVLERKMFVQYLLNELWKGRLEKDLKKAILNQMPPSFWNLEKLNCNGKRIFIDETITDSYIHDKKMDSSYFELKLSVYFQAILIVCCLPSYFGIRSLFDLKCEGSQGSEVVSSACIECGLTSTMNMEDEKEEKVDEENERNPEEFLSMIVQTMATEEELESLLSTGAWISHVMKVLTSPKSAVSIWQLPHYSKCRHDAGTNIIPDFLYTTLRPTSSSENEMGEKLTKYGEEDDDMEGEITQNTCSTDYDASELLLSHRYQNDFSKELFQRALREQRYMRTITTKTPLMAMEREDNRMPMKTSSLLAMLPYYQATTDKLYAIVLEQSLFIMPEEAQEHRGSSKTIIDDRVLFSLTDILLFTVGLVLSFQ